MTVPFWRLVALLLAALVFLYALTYCLPEPAAALLAVSA